MKTTIQIIDDNVALTTLLAKTLAKFGYDPVVENNPLLAINTARHYLPDLILLDVMMPERDGGRVLADLRADLSLRYIPVVLLTGIAREVQALADTGGIHSIILSKPVQLKELIQTIEEQLN
jgi:two-component system phosphate regulon response regulator PhoB